MIVDRRNYYWHADEDALPDAAAVPWTSTGATVATLGASGVRLNVSVAEVRTYSLQAVAADPVSKVRRRDVFDLQVRVAVASSTPGWASGEPCVGLYMDDGARQLAVVVGASVALVHPTTGALVDELVETFDGTREHVVRLRKESGTRWIVEIDAEVVGELPYDAAPTTAGGAPGLGFGNLDGAGTSDATWNDVEAAVNGDVVPAWRTDRVRLSLPAAVGNRWTPQARALARAIGAVGESISRAMGSVQRQFSAGRLDEVRFTAAGDVLPSALTPAWTITGSSKVSILRERIRIANASVAATVAIEARFTGTLPTQAERYVGGRCLPLAGSADAQGRLGPYLVVDDGTKRVHAWMLLIDDYHGGWALADNNGTGAITLLGDAFSFPLPPFGWGHDAHDVSLHVLGDQWVLLVVDGQVVSRRAYSEFTIASSQQAGGVWSRPTVHTVDWSDLRAGRRLTDLGRRPAFNLRLIERLIHVGGRERNDEEDIWLRERPAMHRARGTTFGILEELKRICQSQDCAVVVEATEGDWYLETTWPEVSPIYLETASQLRDVFAEFFEGAPNFTPQRLAEVIAWYLLPISVVELEYWACLAVELDGNSSVPVSGTTRLPVVSTYGFEVGQEVHVRDAANTTRETTTITAISAGVHIDVEETVGTWVTGDRVRWPIVRS